MYVGCIVSDLLIVWLVQPAGSNILHCQSALIQAILLASLLEHAYVPPVKE